MCNTFCENGAALMQPYYSHYNVKENLKRLNERKLLSRLDLNHGFLIFNTSFLLFTIKVKCSVQDKSFLFFVDISIIPEDGQWCHLVHASILHSGYLF